MTSDSHSGGQATPAYWQSLGEWLASENGTQASSPDGEAVDRREILKLLGASIALAGASGCQRERTRQMLPYTIVPREMTPGIAQSYATAMELDGFATGLLVRSNDGRPTKIEGNPDHPASLGAAGPFEQASVLGLYDPHRARASRGPDGPSTFDQIVARMARPRSDAGAKLRFLLEPTGSPLIEDLLRRVAARHAEARFTFYSPIRTPHPADGGRMAFGVAVQPQYFFSRADVILAIDADFLSAMPFSLRYARHFAGRRRTSLPGEEMNRLYVVESAMSPTGSVADHRLRRKPSEIPAVLGAVAAELAALLDDRVPANVHGALASLISERDRFILRAIAKDMARHPKRALVVVGEDQPPEVHALGQWVNVSLLRSEAFGAIAPTPIEAGASMQSLANLIDDIGKHQVDTLIVLGGNPAYTAPADLDFARRLALVDDSVYLGAYENETAGQATWFVPAAHFLESWGDARAYDGTVSLVQPLIEPLFGGRSAAELLAVFAGETTPSSHALLRSFFDRTHPGKNIDAFWAETLTRGLLDNSASALLELEPKIDGVLRAIQDLSAKKRDSAPSLELAFLSDHGVYDGRFANNGWLQEFPKPMTKLTWDNAALMSPSTAARLGLAQEDVVEVGRGGRWLRLPVLVVAGHADEAASVHLGYGRTGAEALARDVGANAYLLRTSDALSFADSIEIRKVTGARHPLAITQIHMTAEGRTVALSSTLERWRAEPSFASAERGPVPSFFDARVHPGEQWAMTIDTSICTGCGACVLGCQSENNVFVVGKESVLKKREMHWLRIDTYFSGSPREPQVLHQPMLCQHCEKAPCEYVCPVNATVHSPDGLNEMIYNRCVGTRFCSNNCPYKVRRFNWFDWVDHQPHNQGLVRLQRNPNVTVRERGVMEKCTYCVQRIRGAEIAARNEHRAIRPGEVVTACQAACPTTAIQFGSLTHTASNMVRWREESRSFDVLHELGTSPRTRYLARIQNPNPEIPW